MKWLQFVIAMIALSIVAVTTSGCASFNKKIKALLNGGGSSNQASERPQSNSVKFSDRSNVISGPKRQYHRVTKESLAQEAQLDDRSGSLWNMEGQGGYLFSQNIMRMIGDPIAVRLEGEPKEQLDTKVSVIRKLLSRLEARAAAQAAAAAAAERGPAGDKGDDKSKKEEKAPAQAAKPPAEPEKTEFNMSTVPTRIVERTTDGNYRVKGSQPMMIGQREYKVIVTGIVRAEDFSEDGISATRLLDPKFDVVSMRKREEM